jgi:hypothetical protein
MTTEDDGGGVVSEPWRDPDEIVVDEILVQLCDWRARLCHFEFYARHIAPLQEAYGDEAVAAALRRHYAMLRGQASDHIRGLQRNALWLKRERRRR